MQDRHERLKVFPSESQRCQLEHTPWNHGLLGEVAQAAGASLRAEPQNFQAAGPGSALLGFAAVEAATSLQTGHINVTILQQISGIPLVLGLVTSDNQNVRALCSGGLPCSRGQL